MGTIKMAICSVVYALTALLLATHLCRCPVDGGKVRAPCHSVVAY